MDTILITGATGYIGSMLVKRMIQIKQNEGDKPLENAWAKSIEKFIFPVRNKEKAMGMFAKDLQEADIAVEFVECSLEHLDAERIDSSVDYIIHCAAATTSSYMISNPVETADGIVLGTRNLLQLARKKKVKSMVYLSSMEVYGQVQDIGRARSEEELGEVRLDNPRSCYPLGKRMAEHYCHVFAVEYGVPVKVARLAQTFGSGVRPEDNRVYMQFARAAMNGTDIVLKTTGRSMGNYCAIEDALSGIFTILTAGRAGEIYNIVNEENTICIKDMAQLVADKIAGGRICVKIEAEGLEKTGYAPETGLRLSGEKLKALGWMPQKTLLEMYEDIIATLKCVE